MKRLLIYIFILSYSSVNAQDSLQLYSIPIWKAWRIARDLSTLDRQTILLDSATKVIALKNDALKSAELALQASDSAYLAKENEAKACRLLIENQNALQKVEIKRAEKKGLKKGVKFSIVVVVALEVGRALLRR